MSFASHTASLPGGELPTRSNSRRTVYTQQFLYSFHAVSRRCPRGFLAVSPQLSRRFLAVASVVSLQFPCSFNTVSLQLPYSFLAVSLQHPTSFQPVSPLFPNSFPKVPATFPCTVSPTYGFPMVSLIVCPQFPRSRPPVSLPQYVRILVVSQHNPSCFQSSRVQVSITISPTVPQ